MRISSIAAIALAAALAGACAYPGQGSRDYRYGAMRGEQSVRFGVVDAVREVRISPYDTGVGTATGAILGGIAGSHAGSGSGHAAGAVAGAVLGGIIGQNIERSGNERLGVELTVLLDSGRYIAVVQEADESFRVGDRVRVLSGRGQTRVAH